MLLEASGESCMSCSALQRVPKGGWQWRRWDASQGHLPLSEQMVGPQLHPAPDMPPHCQRCGELVTVC